MNIEMQLLGKPFAEKLAEVGEKNMKTLTKKNRRDRTACFVPRED